MSKEKIWHLFSRKLSGEASQEELTELFLYLEDHPNLKFQMDALGHVWIQQNVPDRDYLEATYLLHLERMKKLGVEPRHADDVAETDTAENVITTSFFYKHKYMVAAAAFVAILIAAFFVFSNRNPQNEMTAEASPAQVKQQTVVTQYGTNKNFKLPDGSVVWLNAGSKLDYTNVSETGTGTREVYLTGEAFFDVVKNPKRPFIIHTSSIDVKVLGTKFNVKAYPNDKTVETSLVQGSVEVFVKNRPGEKYLLKPNQKLVLLNEPEVPEIGKKTEINKNANLAIIAIKHLTYGKNDTLSIETSWIRNKLEFKDETFAEIARKMERWYDVTITFKTRELETEELNGDFSKETLRQALDALRFTTNFNYKIDGKTVIIY
nr:FecR family protein [uncultured Lacibacter sp.]